MNDPSHGIMIGGPMSGTLYTKRGLTLSIPVMRDTSRVGIHREGSDPVPYDLHEYRFMDVMSTGVFAWVYVSDGTHADPPKLLSELVKLATNRDKQS